MLTKGRNPEPRREEGETSCCWAASPWTASCAWSKPKVLSRITDPRSIAVYCDEEENVRLRTYGRHPENEGFTYTVRRIDF